MNLRQANVLVVDDDKDVLTAVRFLLKTEAGKIITEHNPENIHRILSEETIHILLLDMNFNSAVNTGNEGLFWLRQVKKWSPETYVIMITAYADIDLAVTSLKEGASDFIIKPWQNDKLINTVKEILEKKNSTKQNTKPESSTPVIIGESSLMKDLFQKINKIAPTDANVLILGENGTGKDLIAQIIHQLSVRKKNPFVKIDVGALTETLFESELFGHKKGAFTDAREDRKGLIQSADKGTLFLDEIININLIQQAKLLTVLQNRQVTPLGSNTPIPVDIRLISATNAPFSKLANEQYFRKDLIYRINTVELRVPPLRERGNDILLLSEHFLRIYENKYLKYNLTLSKHAQKKLTGYSYPGNVRELQYAIERAVIMSDKELLEADDIIFSPLEQNQKEVLSATDTYNLEELEKSTIEKVLAKHQGNISRVAKELGITRASLYRRMNKYNI